MADTNRFLEKSSEEKMLILLPSLEAGESRESLAARLGYQSVKSLDSFLRRRDYIWDRHQQKYIPKPIPTSDSEEIPLRPPDRVMRILTLWGAPNAEARAVAKQAGFADHREMARYMAAHGYVWSTKANTYAKMTESATTDDHHDLLIDADANIDDTKELLAADHNEAFLQWLASRKDALQSLLSLPEDPPFLPRYLVPGVLVTKSVHISHLLAQLARDYSQEKRVSQREIFEVALIEFFKRHGYHDKVKQLFQ